MQQSLQSIRSTKLTESVIKAYNDRITNLTVAMIGTLLIAYLHYQSSSEIRFLMLYFLPLLFVTNCEKTRYNDSVFFAFCCTVLWLYCYFSKDTSPDFKSLTYNSLLSFGVFLFCSYIMYRTKKYKKRLIMLNRELKEVNLLKNRYLGIAAHDLRNPLGVVNSSVDLLIKQSAVGSLTPGQLSVLKMIERNTFKMKHMIDDLLNWSQVENGRLNLRISTVNYYELLNDIAANFYKSLVSANLKLSIDVESPAIEVDIDRLYIEEVYDNLLSNAIKYSPAGSQIVIKVKVVPQGLMSMVTDYGSGIPEKEISRIFDPFEVGSILPRSGEKSTGLGLSIARKIVEEHGGTINVISKWGEGSTFYFLLPLSVINTSHTELRKVTA
jgi:signal transduction histidine kinase